VTGRPDTDGVTTQEPAVGVCVVKVEQQSRGALIRVQRVPDLHLGLRARWEPAADVEAALRMVRGFLEEAWHSTSTGTTEGGSKGPAM
jgi:hypothetical protein